MTQALFMDSLSLFFSIWSGDISYARAQMTQTIPQDKRRQLDYKISIFIILHCEIFAKLYN